jgi:hypothetical protein
MKNIWFLGLLVSACSIQNPPFNDQISLEGRWQFRIDSMDAGLEEAWYNLELQGTISLPGSIAENGYGEEVSLSTPWTGSIVDSSYFFEERYARYRDPGQMKIPFWLKPVKYYKGPAWYQKEIKIPGSWDDKRIILHLERCHWESMVFINGKSAGSCNSLSTPHEYDLTSLIAPGRNLITIRIDNRLVVPVGINSHSVSDHTQSNWNGMVGDIFLRAENQVSVSNLQVYPDLGNQVAMVEASVMNHTGEPFAGTLEFTVQGPSDGDKELLPVLIRPVTISGETATIDAQYRMGEEVMEWSEFHPDLYTMTLHLKNGAGDIMDTEQVEFGMRDFSARGSQFYVNGSPVFLRGTLECCIFPLTGYPPTDHDSWEQLLTRCKEHGLNHLRFHSWCPPKAAFEAADRLGFYLQVECGSWANQGSSIGDGNPLDSFIYREGDRILAAYGNHASFCMMAYGNEPAGREMNRYLTDLMEYWRNKDNRRVYTAGAGWPLLPSNDFHNGPQPRIQQWGAGLGSIINAEEPQTQFDFREVISAYDIPFVSHEIGQWCVYPDFSEIEQYTGVLKPTNFEIFRETLEENHMGDLAGDFLMASGKLQALCYKAEIEAALRTPGLAGFQLLQLHDFPGQGTALVGVLNPFFQSKGYISPGEFRAFCNRTVPLARMEKLIFRENEEFSAAIEVAHFGEKPIMNPTIRCTIQDGSGRVLHEVGLDMREIPAGNLVAIGEVSRKLDNFNAPAKYLFKVSIEDTPYSNWWEFWVYPEQQDYETGGVTVTDTLDADAIERLSEGGSVLLLTHGKIGEQSGAEVQIGFSSIFWNTAWTGGQAPHTLGIRCDPGHPLFDLFPTEYHSNWQWWDPVTHSQAMIMDHFPGALRPLVQPIDTWFENRRLGLVFEARVEGGKLMVCSIDLKNQLEERPVSEQLLKSILTYMNSAGFDPEVELAPDLIGQLWE